MEPHSTEHWQSSVLLKKATKCFDFGVRTDHMYESDANTCNQRDTPPTEFGIGPKFQKSRQYRFQK